VNIYIVVEIKNREFIPKLLLSLQAACSNHVVYVGNITQLLKKNFLKPGLLHHKSLTPTKNRFSLLKKLKAKNFLVSSLDEEVGGVNKRIEYLNTRYGKKTVNLADLIFTWGKFDYYNLTKRYKNYKDKFINSGNPRVDLWRSDFQSYYGKKEKKYILVSSNYNFLFGVKKLIQQYNGKVELDYFKRGEVEKEYLKRISKEGNLLEDLIPALKNLSKKFKYKKFIFRPHPEEDENAWKDIFYDCKNIFVQKKGSLSEVLNGAEAVLHNGCTGGLEASLRNIPTIAYMSKGDMSAGHSICNRFSTVVNSEKNLIKKLSLIFKSNSKNSLDRKQKKEISARYENLYNFPAYKKIVQEWNKIENPKLRIKNKDILFKNFFLKKKLKKFMTSTPYIPFKFEPFSKNEINRIKSKFDKFDPNFKNVSIEIIGDDVLKVQLKKSNN
tara:strand:- start:12386 stop:13705 length:1320 start_codon:yes stop_codon:yes gene_type:complete